MRRARRVVHLTVIIGLLLSTLGGNRPLQPRPALASTADDEFESLTLDPKWSWVREDPSHWSLSAHPGYLRIITQATDLSQAANTAPLLLQPTPSGDFAITTRLVLAPTQTAQQAGLLLYTDDDNYISLTYGFRNTPVFQLGKEVNASFTSLQQPATTGGAVYLQLIKLGQDILGYSSPDGSTWTQVGQFSNVPLTFSQMGLVALNEQGSTAPEIAADFDFVHEAALPCVVSPADDEFAASTLDPKWHWVREDPSHWSLTANPGFLRIVTQATDIYQTTNTAPLLLQAASTGDFDVTTRVTFAPTQAWQQAGILLYANDDNYVRLTYGSWGGSPRFEFGREVGARFQGIQAAGPSSSPVYLRIRKSGQTFTGAYSQDGITWTPVGQYVNVSIAVSQIGLSAINGGGSSAAQIPADFDFVHVTAFPCAATPVGGTTPPAGTTTNVYDPLGRLAAVIDPASDTALYAYDADGNLLGITRQSSAQAAILGFAPRSGPVGTSVTITGTGFSTTPEQDTVAFNGVATTVSAATATQLVVTVPAGATTGPITVTSPAGSATSSTPFTVGSPNTPTISGFSPTIGAPGTIVTLSGSNFEPSLLNNTVAFNGTRTMPSAATATSLTASVPGPATSGRLSVTTPGGAATSSADFFVPPPGFAASDVEVARRMAFGDSTTVTISTAGRIGLILFDGSAGQRIGLQAGNSMSGSVYLSLFAPDGTILINRAFVGSSGAFLERSLPAAGTYTILVDPYGAATGNATLALYSVPPDVTGTIVPGGATVGLTVTTPGQNAQFTFDGSAGQRISLQTTNNMSWSIYISIYNPDGSVLVNRAFVGDGSSGFIDATTLAATGTYRIVVDPYGNATGNASLTLYGVPPDVTGTITIGGPAVTVTTMTPGQNAQLTFDGTAGQQVTLQVTNSMSSSIYVSIYNPDGSTLVNRAFVGSSGATVKPTLPETGTYRIFIDPYSTATGSATLTLTQTTAMLQAGSLAAADRSGRYVPARATLAVDVLSGWTAAAQPALPSAATDPASSPPAGSQPSDPPTDDRGPDGLDAEDWVPGPMNLRGDWRSGHATSPWIGMPPLQANPGVTALAGQVLTLAGDPLAGVTLAIDDRSTQTDETGRFLLPDLTAGHHVLVIDGGTASTLGKGKRYGRFEVGVDVVAGETTALPYTIWMPKLDPAHTVSFTSPTTDEVVLTTPRIPGLEVHLPKGSVVTDAQGNPVTELGITPIPVDQPPFPLPAGVQVPIYFTVQPAGSSILPDGAWIVYPNYMGAAPGTRIDFWHYDPQTEGWYIYGQGTVTPDGQQIVPDPGVRIYEFTGAMIGSTGNPPSTYPAPGSTAKDGEPVDLGTGLFVLDKTDLALPDVLPLVLTRTYRPGDPATRAFGVGSTDAYDLFLYSTNNYQTAELILPDGGRIHYTRISPGTSYTDAIYEHTATPTMWYKSRLSWNGNGWNLTLADGMVYVFGEYAPLQAIRDRYGNQLTITRSGGQTGNITQLRSPSGRWIAFSYDASNRVTAATDSTGRTVQYTYDAGGHLATVTDPAGGVTTYTYDANSRLATITDATGITFLTNTYDANGRVSQQTQADGTTEQFSYTLDANGTVTQTDVTDPRGTVRRVTFNSAGYALTDTRALGDAEQQTVTVTREATSNRVTSLTDARGRRTDLAYDEWGQVTSVTRLAGTPSAVTTTLTYEPSYHQVASVTDPLGRTTTFTYDTRGSLTRITDPLEHTTTLGYNNAGQLVSVADALGNNVQLGYDVSDLVRITDPLGHTTTRWVDQAGRPITVTDPLGNVTRYTYDPLNEITQLTDPLGGVTGFGYDANGNLLSVTDPRNSVTTYTYDTMDRVTSQTDPLLRVTRSAYDANGNPTSTTDPMQQTTSVTYDRLNRPVTVTYADGSTTTATYDAGNRLTQVVDTQSGTLAFGYDDLDRLTSEQTAQGTVSYGYDLAGRRTAMTVSGQTPVSYAYDAADRLTQLQQGSATVSLSYDQADRRTSLTLPNGITVSYSYDQASQLTGLTYSLNGTTLGDLSYGYDAAGQRTTVGGSEARTGLPQAVSGAVYDAANQLTQWQGTPLSYDANGNLTSDGTNTYTWDARGQLTAISGGPTASFAYDVLGRRTTKTVNGITTRYRYDGANLVQELTGGSPSVTYLTGLAIDEVFTRTDASGTQSFLTDALGSTVALADGSGALTTQYTYDPFGNTTASGMASDNALQYTGRENDGTGLYYYRARYYNPALQRFLSQDPLGFGGGDVNLYGYVGNSPTNFTDPSGQVILALLFGCAVGAAWGAGIVWHVAGRKADVGDYLRAATAGCATGLLVSAGVVAVAGLMTGSGLAATAEAGGAGLTATAARFDWTPDKVEHIFRDVAGHVNPTTVASRVRLAQLFEQVASNPANERSDSPLPQQAIQAGVRAFTQAFRNGEQVWVYVRNGVIQDAGINPPGAWR